MATSPRPAWPASRGNAHLEPRDASLPILLEMRQESFDERMPRCEEIDALVLDRVLAIERADEGRPARDAGQAVDDRLVSEFDGVGAPAAHLLDAKAKPRSGVEDELFDECVEVLRDAAENRRTECGAIGIAVQLLVRGLVNPRPRRLCGGEELLELRIRQAVGLERDLLKRALDVGELRLDSGHRLAEEPESLEQPDDVGTDARRRTEIDNFDRYAAADAIQSPDTLLHRRGFPRQVVEYEAMAELEVAPFAARFGRHKDAWPVVGPKQGDLRVTPRRRQLLVEDAAAELRARAERVAQHLERLAMGHEHERLLVRLTPALRLRQQPLEARIGSIHRLRLLPQLGLVRPQHRLQRRAGS